MQLYTFAPIILHMRKLANNIPFRNQTKTTTSYRPIPLPYKTLENTILPHITTQHSYKINHSTGLNQKQPPAHTSTLTLDMCKALDTENIHKVFHTLLTLIYHPACTHFRNSTSTQRQFNTGVPQRGIFHPHSSSIYIIRLNIRVGLHYMVTYYTYNTYYKAANYSKGITTHNN